MTPSTIRRLFFDWRTLLAVTLLTTSRLCAEPDDLLPDESWLDDLETSIIESRTAQQDRVSYYLQLTAGSDTEQNHDYHALFNVLFGTDFRIDTAIGQSSLEDDDSRQTLDEYELGFGSAAAYGTNWHISTRAWGKEQTLETRDTAIEVNYRTLDLWYASVSYEQGNVELFAKPGFSGRLTSIDTDRSSWSISLARDIDDAGWWLSYVNRDYERDITALSRRPRLQFILQSVALDLAYTLSSDEITLGYQWFLDSADLGMEFSRVTSAVDSSDSDFLSVRYRYYVDGHLNLQASLQQSLNQNLTYLSLGLGLGW